MKGKFTEEESALFHALEDKKAPIQAQLDAHKEEVQQAMNKVNAIRDKIKALRPQLVPFAEMQAALASPVSRDKYYPDMSKNQFIEHVKKSV